VQRKKNRIKHASWKKINKEKIRLKYARFKEIKTLAKNDGNDRNC
jgi:hypothetical protein